MDQVYEVAQSFGLNLPNVYALENLQTFNAQFTGETGSRAYVAETWKRFLHNMVYFNKTKGSRTSFDALLSTYGINSPVLQIKETTQPSSGNYIRSDELTYGLEFTGSATNYVTVPFVSGSITASSVQLSFNPTTRYSSSLLTTDNWAIDLVPHPSASKLEYGRIHVVSGSTRTIIATSSYFPLFSDDYTNIMLRSQSYDISIIQTDGDQILFQESASVDVVGVPRLVIFWLFRDTLPVGAAIWSKRDVRTCVSKSEIVDAVCVPVWLARASGSVANLLSAIAAEALISALTILFLCSYLQDQNYNIQWSP